MLGPLSVHFISRALTRSFHSSAPRCQPASAFIWIWPLSWRVNCLSPYKHWHISWIQLIKGLFLPKIDISLIYHSTACRWRLQWHFLIYITVREFHKRKEFHLSQGLKRKKTTSRQNTTWLHSACVMSPECSEGATVQFDLKRETFTPWF